MRLLVEIFIIGALIYLGWEKPFKQWATEIRAKMPIKQTAAASQETVPATATPTSTPLPFLRPIQRATVPPGA